MSYPNVPISFPGLFGDWQFTASGKLLDLGNGVYWYGVLIAAGLMLGLWFAMRQAPKYGLKGDDVLDMVLWCIPLCILGSRIYYVLFYLDRFRRADGSLDFAAMVRIWDGGIAIYGTIIAACIVLFVFCRVRKLDPRAMADCGVMGLLIGQAVGRWGNFMNREAFGAMTDVFCRMRLHIDEHYYIDVHPTFLYESLWNLLGLALIYFVVSRRRRFAGENACFYFAWYGLGRFFIEGLRTDSLYLFDWTLFGERIRVSQALSAVLFLAAIAVWTVCRKKTVKKSPSEEN